MVLALALPMTGACSPTRLTDAGWVVDIEVRSLTQIDAFTLRTSDGTQTRYRVGVLELDGGAFPATHLREHMALVQPIAVAYEPVDGDRLVTRLVDAPWLRR